MLSRRIKDIALLRYAATAAARQYSASPPTGVDPATLRSALSYCVNQVKTYDYDNYVWAIQLPPELRTPIITLRAFNVETGLIADHARTEMLVLMRTQWWRDAVNAAFKQTNPPNQPVITALSHLLSSLPPQHTITRYRLQRIINTREQDLTSTEPPPTVQALEDYAEGTMSQLLYLQLEAAGVGSKDAEHAASHLGKAAGIVSLLRNAVTYAKRGRVYLPREVCESKGVQPEDVLKASPSEGVKDATLEVASVAKTHLDHARSFSKDMPKGVARQLMLPAVACGLYLEALEGCNFDMFDGRLQQSGGFSQVGYQLRLKWHMLRNTY